MAAKTKQGRRGKREDKRPARARYWAGRHLERNKVRNMKRANKRLRQKTDAEVANIWHASRGGRRMKGGG